MKSQGNVSKQIHHSEANNSITNTYLTILEAYRITLDK